MSTNIMAGAPMQQMAALYLQQPKVIVASLYPLAIDFNRPYKSDIKGGYNTAYNLAASDGDTPSLLAVGPGAQNTYVGEKRYTDQWETADAIAKDVVRNARSVPLSDGLAGPAVWICEGDQPTPEECRRYRKGQEIWAGRRTLQARDWHIRGKADLITELDRTLGKWLRLNPAKHLWMMQDERTEMKACVYCASEYDVRVPVCGNCNRVVNPKLFAAVEAELASMTEDATNLDSAAKILEEEEGPKFRKTMSGQLRKI